MELMVSLIVGGLAIAYVANRALRAASYKAIAAPKAHEEPELPPLVVWKNLALSQGLTLISGSEHTNRHPDDLKMIGTMHGFSIELAMEHDTTYARRFWGRIRFQPALKLGMDIDQNSRFLERGTLRTGDATFDAAFVIRGNDDPAETVSFLNNEVRASLVKLTRSVDWVAMTDDGLWWTRHRPGSWTQRGPKAKEIKDDLMLMNQLALAFRNVHHAIEQPVTPHEKH